MQNKCKRCKINILSGIYCNKCYNIKIKEQAKKQSLYIQNKINSNNVCAISKIKDLSDLRYWSTSHRNCFKCTFGKGESEEHINKKFERWKFHRKAKRDVFCELILKNGMGRPDLLIIDKGFIFIEEIVKSEKEASILIKRNKYPFNINVIYCD